MPDIRSESPEERLENAFCMVHGSPYCVLGPETLKSIEPQLRVNRQIAERHASETGRQILDADTAKTTAQSWSRTYDELPLLVTQVGIPAQVESGQHGRWLTP